MSEININDQKIEDSESLKTENNHQDENRKNIEIKLENLDQQNKKHLTTKLNLVISDDINPSLNPLTTKELLITHGVRFTENESIGEPIHQSKSQLNQKSLYNDEKELIFEKDNLLLNKAL